jgi:MSHA pilin protein MshA
MNTINPNKGFTLIELVIVIVILGVLAVTAAPKFINISSDAKIAVLNNIAGNMESTITMVQAKAHINGLTSTSVNPDSGQSNFVIDFGFASSELHFSNLCPESRAEMGDAVDFFDFLELPEDDLERRIDNQYSLIGYDVPSSGTPTTQGCYIIYDSFATPNCTIEIVDIDC